MRSRPRGEITDTLVASLRRFIEMPCNRWQSEGGLLFSLSNNMLNVSKMRAQWQSAAQTRPQRLTGFRQDHRASRMATSDEGSSSQRLYERMRDSRNPSRRHHQLHCQACAHACKVPLVRPSIPMFSEYEDSKVETSFAHGLAEARSSLSAGCTPAELQKARPL